MLARSDMYHRVIWKDDKTSAVDIILIVFEYVYCFVVQAMESNKDFATVSYCEW